MIFLPKIYLKLIDYLFFTILFQLFTRLRQKCKFQLFTKNKIYFEKILLDNIIGFSPKKFLKLLDYLFSTILLQNTDSFETKYKFQLFTKNKIYLKKNLVLMKKRS